MRARRWWSSGRYLVVVLSSERRALLSRWLPRLPEESPVWLRLGVPRVVAAEAASGLPVLAELARRLGALSEEEVAL